MFLDEKIKKLLADIDKKYPKMVSKIRKADILRMFDIPAIALCCPQRYGKERLKRMEESIGNVDVSKFPNMFFWID